MNEHISINSYDTNLFDVFLTQNGVVEGLFGEIGTNGGRMVFTAPDNCLHGNRNGSGAGLNQYNLCLNSVKWVADGTATVPAPGTLVLLAIGLLGFGISRRPLR